MTSFSTINLRIFAFIVIFSYFYFLTLNIIFQKFRFDFILLLNKKIFF